MFGVNGWELVLLVLIAFFVLGPDKLPEYAAKLARAIRKLRVMAEGAREQLRDQLGPEYDDIDWRQYDPRQYDPRRIVREALLEPLEDAVAPVRGEVDAVRDATRLRKSHAAAAAVAAADAGRTASVGESGYEPAVDDGPVDVRPWSAPQGFDPTLPTPYDTDAT
ncbi:MAG: Sec-independent protein translocase subunit TatB [Micrococcales bacterium]|uniref:Sec-independent protein translocase subunit TatB n=1 Tax=Phycicoccus sp. TaxID=1902410 RepID=UPI0019B10F06|nr:Sec-independent protein translocase subunit TatB [Phycicoccus sp.]MBD3783743.1 Sec-independent protein translocase subunit TatB [Micrococcales bacterium]HMM94117.1 Sec-independent protein translocase subunit TatB [Phycicoccus sp.]